MVGWYYRPVRRMGARCVDHGTHQCARELGRMVASSIPPKRVDNGHPITAQAPLIDVFPSVASKYSLGRRLHYSVPVKHGYNLFSLAIHTWSMTTNLTTSYFAALTTFRTRTLFLSRATTQ